MKEQLRDFYFDRHRQNAGKAPARAYKDRLFRMIFREKEAFLELYNAMNGTNYQNPDDLLVTTLENAIYLSMKNDVSFLLYDQLTLYEHQSTINPNMPLRNLFYVSSIFSGLTRNQNLFLSRRVRIPEPALELKTLVLNINPGFNQELMEKCRTLQEYMAFVCKVREYSQITDFSEAVEKAIDSCIREGILSDFLQKNRSEVRNVSIFEYDEELHIRQVEEYAREEGLQQGIRQGAAIKLIDMIKRKFTRGETVFSISEDLGEDFNEVEQICHLIEASPDSDTEALYTIWKK